MVDSTSKYNDCFSTVIVGAGINGLLTAANLSTKVSNILVVEKNDSFGGLSQMIEDGFFLGAHHIAGINKECFVNDFFNEIGISLDNDFVSVKFVNLFHKDKIKEIPIILDELLEYLKNNYPDEIDSINKFFRKIKIYASYFLNADEKGLQSMFLETSTISFEEFLKQYSLSDDICQILTLLSPGYGGIGIQGIAFNNLSLLISYGLGSGYIKGCNTNLINYLKDFAENNGVTFLKNCTCTDCKIIDESTLLIKCNSGGKDFEILTEDVIFCSYPFDILSEIISNTRIKNKLKKFQPGTTVFRLFAKLDYEIPSLKGDTVYMGNYDIKNMDENILLSSESFRLPICMIYSDGKKIMFTFLTSPANESKIDVDKIVDMITLEIPELSNIMSSIFTTCNLEYKKITNTTWGSVFGWERDQFVFMNSNLFSPELRGFRGIYISGNWSTDYGVYGAIRTADKVCKKVLDNKSRRAK